MDKRQITLIIAIIFFTGLTIYRIVSLEVATPIVNQVPVINQTPSIEKLETIDEEGWLTYANEKLGYSLKYPRNYSLYGNSNRIAMVAGLDNRFFVKYKLDAIDNSLENWVDSEPVGDIQLGGRQGKKFNYKYCENSQCGPEILAYVVQHNDKLLGLELEGDFELNLIEEKIISTFKFFEIEEKEYSNNSTYIVDKTAYYKDKNGLEIVIAESINDPENETNNISYRKTSLSPSGKFILVEGVGYEWSIIKVYDVEKKKIIYATTRISAPIFYNNDSYFYSCGFNRRFGKGTVIVYDLLNNEEVNLSNELQMEINDISEFTYVDIECQANEKEDLLNISLYYSDLHGTLKYRDISEYQFDFNTHEFTKLK